MYLVIEIINIYNITGFILEWMTFYEITHKQFQCPQRWCLKVWVLKWCPSSPTGEDCGSLCVSIAKFGPKHERYNPSIWGPQRITNLVFDSVIIIIIVIIIVIIIIIIIIIIIVPRVLVVMRVWPVWRMQWRTPTRRRRWPSLTFWSPRQEREQVRLAARERSGEVSENKNLWYFASITYPCNQKDILFIVLSNPVFVSVTLVK